MRNAPEGLAGLVGSMANANDAGTRPMTGWGWRGITQGPSGTRAIGSRSPSPMAASSASTRAALAMVAMSARLCPVPLLHMILLLLLLKLLGLPTTLLMMPPPLLPPPPQQATPIGHVGATLPGDVATAPPGVRGVRGRDVVRSSAARPHLRNASRSCSWSRQQARLLATLEVHALRAVLLCSSCQAGLKRRLRKFNNQRRQREKLRESASRLLSSS